MVDDKSVEQEVTSFSEVYDLFLSSITDDMFLEISEEDTTQMMKELLLSAIPRFEYPHDKNLLEPDLVNEQFNCKLDLQEMKILATYMAVEWIGQQLASIENIRQKYSSSDFTFTSQANHLKQLVELKNKYETEGQHLQRLYSRRKYSEKTGSYVPNFSSIMEPRKW